jgi:hypothetical protein
VRTIPACNAVRRDFLHIIDFSLCAVTVRSALAVFTPRGFKRFRKDLSKKNCKMMDFCTMHGKKASFLGGHELLCVHCVSKQLLILISEGVACDELECREVHVYSFTDSSKNSPLSSCG